MSDEKIPWKDPAPMTLANRVVGEAEMIVRLAAYNDEKPPPTP